MSDAPLFSEDLAERPTLGVPPEAVPPPVAAPVPAEEDDVLYLHVDEPDQIAPAFASPFQWSHAMPTVAVGTAGAVPPPAPPPRKKCRLSLPLIAALLCLVVIFGMLGLNALAQTTPPLHDTIPMSGARSGQTAGPPSAPGKKPPVPTPAGKAMPQPTTTPPPAGQGTPVGAPWVPAALPSGWTDAGLTMSDALEAERSAFSFTDREMSLDYRAIGTRVHHGGTMTAAMFLLTPAAKLRFVQHDLRLMNNVLFDHLQSTKLVRSVIDASPQLVQFMLQGNQQYAWVTVSFHLWITQATPQRDDQERDPATGQPRIHTMVVLLLRVPPQTQGANAPMGGIGWLVSTYVLDPTQGALPSIVLPA